MRRTITGFSNPTVKFLRSLESTKYGAIISLVGGRLHPIPFEEIINPKTGRMQARKVDINGECFECARRFQILQNCDHVARGRADGSQRFDELFYRRSIFQHQIPRLLVLRGNVSLRNYLRGHVREGSPRYGRQRSLNFYS